MALFPGCWEQRMPSPGARTEPRPAWYATIAEQFQEWRIRHSRPAWRPVVRKQHGETPDSRFGGPALLLPGEQWPVCDGCRFPLSPFVQLNLATLPPASPFRGEGVFQLFYCRGDSPDRFEGDYNFCEAESNAGWVAYGGGKLVRGVTTHNARAVEVYHDAIREAVTGFSTRIGEFYKTEDGQPATLRHVILQSSIRVEGERAWARSQWVEMAND